MQPSGRLSVWTSSDTARDAPTLNWSVAQELRNAGLVSVPANGRGGVSITRAGQDFLRARVEI
jgi:hypothetical protein